MFSLDAGWCQLQKPRLDVLNERLPIPDSDRFSESDYIESGVGLSFGVDKRLTYLAGDYDEAALQFEEGVSEFQYKAEIWVYLTRAYFYMKSPEQARLALDRAEVAMPDLAERLWQPLTESLLWEVGKRAAEQQIQVDFYSPSQEEFLSLFRLYVFLEDLEGAAGVIRSAYGREGKLRELATTVSGNSQRSHLREADKWRALSDQLRGELLLLGVDVPRDSVALGGGPTENAGAVFNASEETRLLQLRVDFYHAEVADFRTLFEAYQQRNDDRRSSEVVLSLGREINRLTILASVAPSIQEEVRIQERIERFDALKKEFEAMLPQPESAAP